MKLRFLICTLFIFLHQNGLACSCNLGSVEEKLNNAEDVFLGKVVVVEIPGNKNNFGELRIIVTFEVIDSYKGKETSVRLDTFDNGVSCEGYWFAKDYTYLVYTYRIDGKLSTFYCGGVFLQEPENESPFQEEIGELKRITSQD